MNWYIKVIKQYIDFKGRARRLEYWMFMLFHIIIIFALGFLGGMLAETIDSPDYAMIPMIILFFSTYSTDSSFNCEKTS